MAWLIGNFEKHHDLLTPQLIPFQLHTRLLLPMENASAKLYIYTQQKPTKHCKRTSKNKVSVRLECNLKRIQTSLIKRKYNESHLIKFIRCIMLIAPWIDFWPKIRCSNFLSVSFYTLAFSGIVLYLCTFKYSSSFHAHTHSLCYFHSSFILSIKVCILIRTQIHAMNKKRNNETLTIHLSALSKCNGAIEHFKVLDHLHIRTLCYLLVSNTIWNIWIYIQRRDRKR